MEELFYLDNASTTKIFEEEFDILKNLNNNFFNPSASYMQAIESKKLLSNARSDISNLLYGKNGRLLFTGSATESNNMVFEGLHIRAGQTVLVSRGEHPSVYNAAMRLKTRGIDVEEIPLNANGNINENEYVKLLSKDVALVSIMHVSNETGAINDIKKLCKIAKEVNPKVVFHSDGVQAFGKIEVNLNELGVDLYTISAHKVYAPRGIAGLWVKNGVLIDPLLVGGGQEDGYRSSTENVSGAVAFAYASKKAIHELSQNFEKVKLLKSTLISELENSSVNKFMKLNSPENSSPYILSLSFDGIKGEVLMHALEACNILVSTGSACSSKKAGNRTLESMGLSQNFVIGSIRISFSAYEKCDVDYVARNIAEQVERFEKNIHVIK